MTSTATSAASGPTATGGDLADPRLSLGPAVLDDLFPEGQAFRGSLTTFTVLLVLAALIASFGLYQDSVASIIGAMVVAPLGGAIMAFAGALVTYRTRWLWITAVQVSLGAVGVVAIGFLVSTIVPDPLVLTPSLDARTAPGFFDLGVALAAGAAGAYVAARHTGTDALPGVAIAVSLVPPLATVGICLELGRLDDAAGAGLLFIANLAAIVVAAGIVFMLSGVASIAVDPDHRRRVRYGLLLSVAALAVIAIPLVVTGVQRAADMIRADNAAPIVLEWIGERDLEVQSWSVRGSDIALVLEGPDEPGSPEALASSLAAALEIPVELDVRYVRAAHERAAAAP
jgi:uncharacterized hydrophobic protein (TIGR00271 family)